MGTISHNAIVAVFSDEEKAIAAAAEAVRLGCLTLGPSEPGVNNYRTVVVCPDGSKEWWPSSDAGDTARKKFVEYLQSQYCDWVEVQFGELGDRLVRNAEGPV